MKAVGIIRNVDNLGRIVIPKELRRAYNINTGDPVEIFTDTEGRVILRKYKIEDELSETVKSLRSSIDAYGDSLPNHVAVALKKHCFEMKKLLDQK